MAAIIALVGRPNVGKSTLFNVLTRRRDAIVADMPGTTRDYQYGILRRFSEHQHIIVDTGGLVTQPADDIDAHIREHTLGVLREAQAVIFLLDAQSGLHPDDVSIANQLRQLPIPVFPAINKTDSCDERTAAAEFYSLGFAPLYLIAGKTQHGLRQLWQAIDDAIPADEPAVAHQTNAVRIGIVGRPNVGKSTLINQLLGEKRLYTADTPGTTRDSIAVPFRRHNTDFLLIDTAGIRRRSRIGENTIEQASVAQALRVIHSADVVALLLDMTEAISEQDLKLLGLIIDAGKGVMLIGNKADRLNDADKRAYRTGLDRRLTFARWVPLYEIAALHGDGVSALPKQFKNIYTRYTATFNTAQLNTILQSLIAAHPPPTSHHRRIKPRYAHLGNEKPPCIVIHGTQVEALPAAYQRYLLNGFRDACYGRGVPVRLLLKNSVNPFVSSTRQYGKSKAAHK